MTRSASTSRDLHGWLAVDKPAGLSSVAAVATAKRAFGCRKAGHAGTLDRPASGVLAIAFGEATKTMAFATNSWKHYHFTVRFGSSTDTDDATGIVTGRTEHLPDDDEIRKSLPSFTGKILQIPPQYSAVKIGGRRSHQLARDGLTVAIAARPLLVRELALRRRFSNGDAEFRFVCGKGGYVRSVARDIGLKLGCLAHVRELRRTRLGPFGLNDCVEMSDLPTAIGSIAPIETVLGEIQEIPLAEDESMRLRYGQPVKAELDGGVSTGPAWASCCGSVVATGRLENGWFRPKRVFRMMPQPARETAASDQAFTGR